jgi:hypothetical protein
MKLNDAAKKDLEAQSAKIACELAEELEQSMRKHISNMAEDGILQALIYSQLSSWFMAAHFAVVREQDADKRKPPIKDLSRDIVEYATFMFKKFKIVKETH